MKYILGLFILVITMYAQASSAMSTQAQADTTNARLLRIEVETDTASARLLRALSNDTTALANQDTTNARLSRLLNNTELNSTGGQGTQSVTTSAAALPSQASKVVWLQNQNTSGNIYWGFSNGVTTSNGMLLSPNMGVLIETDNLSDIYVIASSTLTIRYVYQN